MAFDFQTAIYKMLTILANVKNKIKTQGSGLWAPDWQSSSQLPHGPAVTRVATRQTATPKKRLKAIKCKFIILR
jgi:hypothetical protein